MSILKHTFILYFIVSITGCSFNDGKCKLVSGKRYFRTADGFIQCTPKSCRASKDGPYKDCHVCCYDTNKFTEAKSEIDYFVYYVLRWILPQMVNDVSSMSCRQNIVDGFVENKLVLHLYMVPFHYYYCEMNQYSDLSWNYLWLYDLLDPQSIQNFSFISFDRNGWVESPTSDTEP